MIFLYTEVEGKIASMVRSFGFSPSMMGEIDLRHTGPPVKESPPSSLILSGRETPPGERSLRGLGPDVSAREDGGEELCSQEVRGTDALVRDPLAVRRTPTVRSLIALNPAFMSRKER